jgi:GNAT superfamily N-acetyltransferase
MLDCFLRSIIHDKRGRQYHVIATECDSENYKRFNIEYRDRRVGYAHYHFEGDDVLFIDDLRLEDKAMRSPWFFVDLIYWAGSFPPERFRVTNYQKRGLGTAMIKFLVSFAESESVKRIEGEVKHHDFKDDPDLPDWYRRRGFSVVMGDKTAPWVAKISLAV